MQLRIHKFDEVEFNIDDVVETIDNVIHVQTTSSNNCLHVTIIGDKTREIELEPGMYWGIS